MVLSVRSSHGDVPKMPHVSLSLGLCLPEARSRSVCSPDWAGTHCVARSQLELTAILLPQPVECWDYGCEPPWLDLG